MRMQSPSCVNYLKMTQFETEQTPLNLASKSGRNKTRDPGPKSGTKFCQPNMGTKHSCIKLKFMSNVDNRLFL